jgi:hypothetical protein
VPQRKRNLSAPPVVTTDRPTAALGRTLWNVVSDLLGRRDLRISICVLIVIIAVMIAAGVAIGKLLVIGVSLPVYSQTQPLPPGNFSIDGIPVSCNAVWTVLDPSLGDAGHAYPATNGNRG